MGPIEREARRIPPYSKDFPSHADTDAEIARLGEIRNTAVRAKDTHEVRGNFTRVSIEEDTIAACDFRLEQVRMIARLIKEK
jgi:hypothetical protein